jgi:hypothetical protein
VSLEWQRSCTYCCSSSNMRAYTSGSI